MIGKTITISKDAEQMLSAYLAWELDIYETGAMSAQRREEMRTYAVQTIAAIVRDNPEVFAEYRSAMAAEWRRKYPGQSDLGNPWRERGAEGADR